MRRRRFAAPCGRGCRRGRPLRSGAASGHSGQRRRRRGHERRRLGHIDRQIWSRRSRSVCPESAAGSKPRRWGFPTGHARTAGRFGREPRCHWQLKPGEPEAIREAMAGLPEPPRASPSRPAKRTCGSVFTNPPEGHGAGELLDRGRLQGAVESVGRRYLRRMRTSSSTGAAPPPRISLRSWTNAAGVSLNILAVVLEPEVRLLGDIGLEPI